MWPADEIALPVSMRHLDRHSTESDRRIGALMSEEIEEVIIVAEFVESDGGGSGLAFFLVGGAGAI